MNDMKVKGLEKAQIFKIKAGTLANPKWTVPGTGFINLSTYSSKVEIDIEVLGDYAYDYLPQIAYNIDMPLDELKDLIYNSDSSLIKKKAELLKDILNKRDSIEEKINLLKKTEVVDDNHPLSVYLAKIDERISAIENSEINIARNPVIFRISIPFWRLHESCYCGHLYVSKEDFFKGVLIFNKTFGKFCVKILPEHIFLLEDYYNNFIKMLKKINMDDRAFFFACPEEGNRANNIGHFCTVCLKNKVKKQQRKVLNAIKSFKEYPVKHTKSNLCLRNLSIKNSKKLKRYKEV